MHTRYIGLNVYMGTQANTHAHIYAYITYTQTHTYEHRHSQIHRAHDPDTLAQIHIYSFMYIHSYKDAQVHT